MTTILNEMTCGTINYNEDNIYLSGSMCVAKDGTIYSINGGLIYDTTNETDPKKYIGSYTVKPDINDQSKRSIAVNISEIEFLLKAVTAISNMITDVESKYKK